MSLLLKAMIEKGARFFVHTYARFAARFAARPNRFFSRHEGRREKYVREYEFFFAFFRVRAVSGSRFPGANAKKQKKTPSRPRSRRVWWWP